jgi:hypothetical protein
VGDEVGKEVKREISWGVIHVTSLSDIRDPHVCYTKVIKKEEIKMDECTMNTIK